VKFKAIIADVDGTVLDSPEEKVASTRLQEVIERLDKKGIITSVATGRGETYAKPVVNSLNLQYPIIVSAGARIVDPRKGEELWSCCLAKAQLEAVVNIAREYSYKCLWNDYRESEYIINGGWDINKIDINEPIYFFEIAFIPEGEHLSMINRLSRIEGITITAPVAQRPNTRDLHITNNRATKEHAIYELGKILDVNKSQMIGVGDGHNDLHLFEAVGYKVAMGNAVDELKQNADIVIDTVHNDGLAQYLENLEKEMGDEV
jgi:HAD superfamily hydrolase (TIGR01484 family)